MVPHYSGPHLAPRSVFFFQFHQMSRTHAAPRRLRPFHRGCMSTLNASMECLPPPTCQPSPRRYQCQMRAHHSLPTQTRQKLGHFPMTPNPLSTDPPHMPALPPSSPPLPALLCSGPGVATHAIACPRPMRSKPRRLRRASHTASTPHRLVWPGGASFTRRRMSQACRSKRRR